MQDGNRFLDDLAGVVSGAMAMSGGVRAEAEARLRQRLESLFARMDLVRREEFLVARDMAALARERCEALERRVAALEARLAEGEHAGDGPARGGDTAERGAAARAEPA